MNVTPAMQQYYDLKAQYQDAILFFRMGDFYEMFEEDAKIAHKILWIALTTRNKNADNPILLAGIPYHAKEKYLPIFIEAWYKVAIAEQVSNPKAKGIVERGVVRVVTPATLWLESEWYDTAESSIMLSLVQIWEKFSLSIMDISSHRWTCSEFNNFEECSRELYKLSPNEVILEKKLFWDEEIQKILTKKYGLNIYYYDSKKDPYNYLCKLFSVKNLEWYGIEKMLWAQKASSLLHEYICENQKTDIDFLQNLQYESFSNCMDLDESTIKSLDLIYNISTASKTTGTLFWALDSTKTAMGKRLLKNEILHPLQSVDTIKNRQKFIAALKEDSILLDKVRNHLQKISDIDAILSRLSLHRAWPRDLLSLKKSLISIREIISLIEESNNTRLKKLMQ